MNNKWFAIFVVIFLILIGSTIYLGFQKYHLPRCYIESNVGFY